MATYYQYPQSLKSKEQAGHHYLLIDSYESRNAITAGKQVSSIALYVPPNSLQTSYGANYEGLDNAALIAAAGEKSRQLFEQGAGVKGIVAAVTGGAKTQEAKAAGISTAAQKAIARSPLVSTALGAGAGLAVNNHMALVYRGPNSFRSHTFNFSFFPKNEDESDDVKEIINDLRNGMLPRYTGAGKSNGRLSSPFFKMPRMYELDLLIQGIGTNNYINDDMFPRNSKGDRIKHVITNMTVNHDPNGVVSFHSNGAPVQTNMSLTFQETEFITSKDAVDDRYESAINQNISRQNQAQAAADAFTQARIAGFDPNDPSTARRGF
tara:strand:- start:63 stop:1031 length:969 start_codon:yes stop_codon:yes gene_type:complete